MADASDSDSSHPPSSPDRDPEWYVQQWDALADELGTSDPEEILARVQTLKRQMERLDEGSREEEEGLVTISEVENVFQEMNQKMEKLRERNAALAERLEGDDDFDSAFRDLHQKAEQLLDALDATTMEEARERIQRLNRRLEDLYQEKEQLVQAGHSDAEEALDELDRVREERDALRRERDQLQRELEQTESESSASEPDTDVLEAAAVVRDRIGVGSPDQAEALRGMVKQVHERVQALASTHGVATDDTPSNVVEMLHSMASQLNALPDREARSPDAGEALPAEVGEILGIRSVDDAEELDALIADMSERLEHLQHEQKKLEEADLSADGAVTMIESMGAQLADLYENGSSTEDARSGSPSETAALDDALARRIADHVDTTPEAADDLTEVVRLLVDELDARADERAPLEKAGMDVEEAIELIDSMEQQLDDLYQEKQDSDDAAQRLRDIEDVLGISTREEAEELSQLARQMEDQLTSLYEEKNKLEELGLASVDDAVDMIESMEQQLDELYDDKEALGSIQLENTEEQSTFQQLEALYAERQKLQQALGVSSAEDVIKMVETLNTQLDDLYTGRDADVSPEERHEARLWSPEAPEEEVPSSSDEEVAPEDVEALTMNSMEHQLEALYREKETLLHHGFGSAQEAVSRLETQKEQLDALQRENRTYERRFDRLQSELGTESVSKVVEAVQALESEADASLDELLTSTSESSESSDYGVDLEAASPFLDDATLHQLDDLSADELDALEAGAIQLRDDGTVANLNDAAFQLPGLQGVEDRQDVIGENFFLDLAPSTNNDLFFGRFQKGQRRGEIDARFPYTFVSPDEGPKSFSVHLYRTPDGDATWLLFRPA